MALPSVSPAERQAALKKATGARQARAALLEQITSGEVTIASVIARADHDAVVAKTRISKIVQAVPGWGSTRATALLKRLGIAEGRRVAGLEANQAEALIDALSRTAGLLPGAAERIGPCKQDRGRE